MDLAGSMWVVESRFEFFTEDLIKDSDTLEEKLDKFIICYEGYTLFWREKELLIKYCNLVKPDGTLKTNIRSIRSFLQKKYNLTVISYKVLVEGEYHTVWEIRKYFDNKERN